jgi:hypothetical protein
VSRTASTPWAAEPLPFDAVGRLRDLLADLAAGLLADFAAGLDFFVGFALVDFDLRDELGRAEVERFFV